jgi:dihydrodipicolinate synthase/N-acetylneuraminate lyase
MVAAELCDAMVSTGSAAKQETNGRQSARRRGRLAKAPRLRDTLLPTHVRDAPGRNAAEAFTIMRAMGHSSVTVRQKYVHATPEAMERAFERLEAFNQRAIASLPETQEKQIPVTFSATLSKADEDAA